MIRIAALAVFMATSVSAFAAEETAVKPNLAKAKTIAETVCVGCHGADGNSPISANPILAGQGSAYLFKQLTQFKSEDGKPAVRNNPIMSGMTAALSIDDMKNLALYFSQQKMKPATSADAKLVEAGKSLWRKGDFERGIPACAGCHGPAGAGVPAQYPRLAGQYAEYTESQLKNFRSEDRSNDPEMMMRSIAEKLSDKQIKAVADYAAGLR
ncbi:c-type cytochrome [Propionivibrio sp.]|uniref:c-type cytochrome n=1 Tax=Propionivibrio sp. TaxID=2212460 RepID=UPI0025E6613C|nr:c-type cytochrome [Propionivibrio sp.]MBK8743318.1 cytochrome c4 [Propionivibrio sp.]MBK8894658.1 cytochrome c4 [Propionivibrio sp.]MBL0207140.1 cytochrome c4 [Propionivibrio sp.]